MLLLLIESRLKFFTIPAGISTYTPITSHEAAPPLTASEGTAQLLHAWSSIFEMYAQQQLVRVMVQQIETCVSLPIKQTHSERKGQSTHSIKVSNGEACYVLQCEQIQPVPAGRTIPNLSQTRPRTNIVAFGGFPGHDALFPRLCTTFLWVAASFLLIRASQSIRHFMSVKN